MEHSSSLSLSSVAVFEEITRNNRLIFASTPTSGSIGCEPSISFSEDFDSEAEISRRGENKKITLAGGDYLLFKPKRSDSLYCKIMKTNKPEDLIEDLSMQFDESYNEGMSILLQLLVDLMGYQNVIVNYKPRMNFELFLRHLLEHTTDLQTQFKCVLNGTTCFAKHFCIAIFNFLQDFMIVYNKYGRLSCMDILKDLLPFINVMTRSNIRVIRLTTVIIAVKLCTTFLIIRKETERNLEHTTASGNKLKLFELASTIEFLLSIHADNCCLNDPELYRLRIICCREVQDWVRFDPNNFVTADIIKLVRTLISDERNKVRCVALETAVILLQFSSKVEQSDANYIHFQILSKIISKRCKDVDVEVKTLAIKYFTCCITRFPDGITVDTRNFIIERIYAGDIKIAKEAGKFVYNYFLENDNADNIFPFLLKLTNIPNFQNQTDLLVQTLLDIVPELKDFKIMINFLMYTDEEFEDESQLIVEDEIKFLEIIYHASRMLLMEKYEIQRPEIRKNINFVENNERLVNALLSNLMHLLNKFIDEEEGLLWILKITMLINIQGISFTYYRNIILNTLDQLKGMIMINKNKEILILICQIFQKLSSEYSPFKGTALAISKSCIEVVFQKYEKNYNLYKISADISAEIVESIRNYLFLLSILSEYNDIFGTMQWADIYLGWEHIAGLEDISVYQMICCRWYLVWELRYILQHINNPIKEEDLHGIYNSFNIEKNVYMNSLEELVRHSNSYYKKTTAFECVCNITLFINELKTDKFDEQTSLSLDIENQFPVLLMNFVSKMCFQKNLAPIEDKRKFLCKILQLIFAMVLPADCLSKLFIHFLAFEEQYADLFACVLRQLKELKGPMAIATVGMCTLVDSLEDFGIKRTQELSEALQRRNIFPKNIYQIMCQMGINFVVRDESKVALLTILQPYASKLSLDEKQKVVTYMRTNIPRNLFQHDSVIKFKTNLEVRPKKGIWARPIDSDGSGIIRVSPVLALQESDSIPESDRSTSSLS